MKQPEVPRPESPAGTVTAANDFQQAIYKAIDSYNTELRALNRKIWENPELGYEEYIAHDTIVELLKSLNFNVTPHAYNVETSFAAEYGSGGRVVVFNAEYDALPGIGHACGHNLIATSSVAAFLGVAAALKASNLPGRVRIYGTPAEEGGAGKVKLIDAGAYEGVAACLMAHPAPPFPTKGKGSIRHGHEERDCCITGHAFGRTLANTKFNVSWKGRPAHAAAYPYQGLNALDAIVLAYNGVSMLRQQIRSEERIHSVILEGGNRPNVITSSSRAQYYVRSRTLETALELRQRVTNCLQGAALATGCTVELETTNEYADMRPNKIMCQLYAAAMAGLDSPVHCDLDDETAGLGSTDQGNVTHIVPGIHPMFSIPAPAGCSNHTEGFTACAGTDEAHGLALVAAKGLAAAGWRVLSDEAVAREIAEEFKTVKDYA